LTAAVKTMPAATQTGSQSSRQRRDRQPVAAISTAAVISCAATGIQPLVKLIVAP
jgi:hypothetical protein